MLALLLATGTATAIAADDAALYRDLGEQAGIGQLADDFTERVFVEDRMAPFFKGVDKGDFKQHLAEQLCVVSGGPCVYKGKDMKKAHEAMDINRSAFNALVEVLQQSMDAQGIAFSVQNRLLARLAPMHRDIVNLH
jgi:hemoglobin